MDGLTIRFCEQSRYDPMKDAEVTRFMCITNVGTWHTELICGAKKKTHRESFQTYVLNAMGAGQAPREVVMGGAG